MKGVLLRASVLAAAIMLVTAGSAHAALQTWTPNGQKDFVFGSTVSSSGGTGSAWKPESKLFYTADGQWWAVLGASSAVNGAPSAGLYIWHLVDHVWQTTSAWRVPEADTWAKADTLFDAATNTLYFSARDNKSVGSNKRQSNLYSYGYAGGDWTLLSGPTKIMTDAGETLTIARDTLGVMWATWRAGTSVKVAHLDVGATQFSTPIVLSSQVNSDDISSITAFGAPQGKIGVMWSDQNTKRFLFAWRSDADPLPTRATDFTFETAYGAGVGDCPTPSSDVCADDHINLKAIGDDVYAVVKTSLNDPCTSGAAIYPACLTDPLIVLLHRDPATGTWSETTVSPVSVNASRPTLLVSPELDELDVIAEKNYHGIYRWTTSLSDPSFTQSPSAFILTGSSKTGNVVDPTSTKQPFTAASGAVVVASWSSTYYHNELLPSGP